MVCQPVIFQLKPKKEKTNRHQIDFHSQQKQKDPSSRINAFFM